MARKRSRSLGDEHSPPSNVEALTAVLQRIESVEARERVRHAQLLDVLEALRSDSRPNKRAKVSPSKENNEIDVTTTDASHTTRTLTGGSAGEAVPPEQLLPSGRGTLYDASLHLLQHVLREVSSHEGGRINWRHLFTKFSLDYVLGRR